MTIDSRLPSPKGVALAIMEICRRDDATMEEVSRVIQTDPALTARLLQLANSAAHAGRPVGTIHEAVMRLGLAAVSQLAIGFSLVDQHQNGSCKAFDYPGFWSHSLLMALACRELGSFIRVASPDELFACGLLARIGCLALATIHPVEYAELLAQQDAGSTLLEWERQRLQVDHNELTATIMTGCGIATALVEPVSYHEAPETSGFSEGSRSYQLAHLFYHAKCLADLGCAPEAERYGKIPELMLLGGKMGLDANDMGVLVDRIFTLWREWGELLKVSAAALPPYTRIATAPRPEEQGESPAKVRVLLVEDDTTTRLVMEGMLKQMLGSTVYCAVDGKEALACALEVMPQIVVTDWLMPVMNGIELCRALRATEWGQSMYVILLTSIDEETGLSEAFEAGVDDYIPKPVNADNLKAKMRAAVRHAKLMETLADDRAQLKQFAAELAISNRRMEQIALTDLLTGLPNRRAGMGALSQAWLAADRSGQPMSVMMLDIDHFKRVNDTHGHAVGDLVLKKVALAIQEAPRKNDAVCRLGGEEFLLVCPNTDLAAALQTAERLRKKVASLTIDVADTAIQVSISIGLACKESGMDNAEALVSAADKALYAAKHLGRNQSCSMTQGQVHCTHDERSMQ